MSLSTRNTLIHVLKSKTKFHHLIVTPSHASHTYVFTIDSVSGDISNHGIPFVDVFFNHRSAVTYVTSRYENVEQYTGRALIGATVENGCFYIILVKKTVQTAILPDGSPIYTIKETEQIEIPLNGRYPKDQPFSSFPIAEYHVYCEQHDITRPFPSTFSVDDPDVEFIWNRRWRQVFIGLKTPSVCISLVEGFASSLNPFRNIENNITYIIRRSSLHPGLRFRARGLNEFSSPGNEAECELIIETQKQFFSQIWRRGTLPIHFETKVGNFNHKHSVTSENAEDTIKYFESLRERYGDVQIAVIDLLGNPEEKDLSATYRRMVSSINWVEYVSIDQNRIVAIERNDAIKATIEALGDVFNSTTFTVHNKAKSPSVPVTLLSKQNKVLRFNCADSLDRTNFATFAFALFNLKRLIPDHNLTDYLGRTFIISGDLISLLYALSPAGKTNPIRSLTTLSSGASDFQIGFVRKFNQFHKEPDIQRSIEKFTKTKNRRFISVRLSPFHLSIVPIFTSPDLSLFSLTDTTQTFNVENGFVEIVVKLPAPAILTHFRIRLVDPGDIPIRLSISSGNDLHSKSAFFKGLQLPEVFESTFVKFNLTDFYSSVLPVEQFASRAARFVFIRFETERKTFTIGNINIDVIYVNEVPFLAIKGDISESVKKELDQAVDGIIVSKQSMSDMFTFEFWRISNGVSTIQRNIFFIVKKATPCLVESACKLRHGSHFCAKCSCSVQDEDLCFRNHRYFPSLIDPRPVQNSKNAYKLCQSCSREVVDFSVPIKKLEDLYKIQSDFQVTYTETYGIEESLINETECLLSGFPNVCFIDYPAEGEGNINDILTKEKGLWTLRNNEGRFYLSLIAECNIRRVVVEFGIECSGYVTVGFGRFNHFNCSTRFLGKTAEVKIENEQHSNLVSLTILINDIEGHICLKTLSVYGTFCEKHIRASSCIEPVTSPIPRFYELPNKLAHQNRVASFKVNKNVDIKGIVFDTYEGTNPKMLPKSVVIAGYRADILLYTENLLLPYIPSGVECFYHIEHFKECDLIMLYYLDRMESIQPYQIKFVLNT